MTADNLLSWQGEDGVKRCLLIITNDEKHHNQSRYRSIELCEMNDEEEYETVETLDFVDELQTFGIPPGMDA